MDWRDKSVALSRFTQVKSIWSGRDVLLIEGELTRLGVGNDLLDNAASIRRVLCPAENAYDFHDRILAEAAGNRPADLVLVSLGPTAKPLVFDLSHRGYQAIDVGHLDVEYEWYLGGAQQKTQVPGKYVNEVNGGKLATACHDPTYQDQIVCRIP